MSKSEAGKGDKPRPVNQDKYRENYDRIFGEKDANNRKDLGYGFY